MNLRNLRNYNMNSKKMLKMAQEIYEQKVVPHKTRIFWGFIALFFVGMMAGLTLFSVKRAQAAADETCYWVADIVPASWSQSGNWDASSGGAGGDCAAPGGVPDSGTAVIFDGSSASSVIIDVNVSIYSLELQAGYTATFDNATNDKSITVADNVTMDNNSGTVSMGDATWTLNGSFDNYHVGTFNKDLSTVVMNGTGKNIVSNSSTTPLKNLTINGTTTLFNGNLVTEGTATINAAFTMAAGKTWYPGNTSDTKITGTGSVTGSGSLNLGNGSALSQMDGTINVNTLTLGNDHNANIVATQYGSATVNINSNTTTSRTFKGKTGTYTFTGNVTFQLTGTGTYTIDNASNNTNWNFKGNVALSNTGGGTFNWTKGDGTITFSGTGAQTADFLSKTVEDLRDSNTANTVSLSTNGVTTDGLTVDSNANFDLAGQNLTYAVATGTTNDGTILLQGNETLSNVNNFDTNSGTVRYKGKNAADTFDIKGFDYNNLVINDANATKATFRTPAATPLVVNGTFTITAGSFDNATNDNTVTVASDVTMDNNPGTTSMGDATWTVSGSFDNKDVGTWSANSSTLVLNGTGKNWLAKAYSGGAMNKVTISGTITLTSGNYVQVGNDLTVSNSLTINGSQKVNVYGSNADLLNSGTITGAGTLEIGLNGSIEQQSGTIDVANLTISSNHPAANSILAATYASATVSLQNTEAAAYSIVFTGGTATFNGNVTVNNTNAGGTYTVLNSTNNPSFDFKGNLTVQQTLGTTTWTKGNGTITFSGTGAQSVNFLDKTVEDLRDSNTGGTVTLADGVTTDRLTVDSNATFNIAGQAFNYSAATGTTNDGTIKLQGGELGGNVSNLDTNSGTVEYNGAGATIYNLPEYGATDFNNLIINSTAGTDTFRPPANFVIGGLFTLTSGTLDNSANNSNISIAGNITTEAAPTWTKGNGTIILNGSAAQSVDFHDKSVEDLRDSNTAATVTLTDGVTTDALTVDTGAKFDLAGQAFGFAAAAAPSNDGTIYMRGNEALTNVNDLDTNSGWVEFNGGAAYGSLPNYSYNAVNFNGAGSWALGNALSVADELAINQGTVTCGANSVDVNGRFNLIAGTFTAPSATLTIAGNFAHPGGTFTHNSGSVELDGTDQTISGDTTFNNLKKNVAAAHTLTFTAATTQTVNGTLELKGAAGQLLSLHSSADGNHWNIVHGATAGTYTFDFLDVKDSNHTGGGDFIVFNSTDGGNNHGWAFPSYYQLTSDNSSPKAGEDFTLTATLKDSSGGTVDYTGDTTLTFAGADSIGSYNPTTTDKTSAKINFGSAATYAFAAGVANTITTLYKYETAPVIVTSSTGLSSSALNVPVKRLVGTIHIEGQDNIGYITDPDVNLTLTLSDVQTTTGAQVKLASSEVAVGNANYQNYSANTTFTLPDADGRQRIYGIFKDTYGNTSAIAQSNESAPLDKTPPTNPDTVIMRDATDHPQETGQEITYGVLITWKPSSDSMSGIKGYTVSRGSKELNVNNGVTDKVQTTQISGNENSYYVDLDSLEPNISYTYSVKATDNAGNVSSGSGATLQLSKNNEKSGQSDGQDTITLSTTAPVTEAEGKLTNIKDIKAVPSSTVGETTSATISWVNNVPATCQVFYGQDTSYPSKSKLDTSKKAYNTKCKVVISDLQPDTTYHFKVQSVDKDGTAISSSDQTFATKSKSESTSVLELIAKKLTEFANLVWHAIKGFFTSGQAKAADASSIQGIHIVDVSSISGDFAANTIYWPNTMGAVTVSRDGQALGQTDANFFLDATIEKGKDYTYTVNSLSGTSAEKAILPGGTPKITDLKAKATDVTQDSANIAVTWNTIGVPSTSKLAVEGCSGNPGKEDTSLDEFHTVVVTGVNPEATCKISASSTSNDKQTSTGSITYTVPEAEKQRSIFEIIIRALSNAFRNFSVWVYK